MSVQEITLHIRGIKPAPWAGKEWDWRKAVATEARKHFQGSPDSKLSFEVHVIFYFLESTFDKSDLDNLTKPVLDTLFLPNNPQVKDRSLTGALIETDDSRVTKLYLEKRTVTSQQDEGADIIISWVK